MNSTVAQRGRLRSPPHRTVMAVSATWLSISLQTTPLALTAIDTASLEDAHVFHAEADF